MTPFGMLATGTPRMPEWLRAAQESFGGQDGVVAFVLAVAGMASVPLLAAGVYNFLQKRRRRADLSRPKSVFQRVLRRSRLGRKQRGVAWRMARDLRLPHPSVLFLSRTLFDRYADRWLDQLDSTRRDRLESTALEGLPAALFGPRNAPAAPKHEPQ